MPASETPPASGSYRTAILGAVFLMASSAVGPGFLTQTAVFTDRLGASFGFAIAVSVLADLGAQVTIWRVLIASGRRAQDVAGAVAPGLGVALAVLVVIGGLGFNIGNVAGAGLGANVVTGIDVRVGAAVSACLAMLLFVLPGGGRAIDRVAILLGCVKIALATTVAVASAPPVAEALKRTLLPSTVDALSIVTIVGGTVGGYLTFAGAHRLLDAGVHGEAGIARATRSATSAIGLASAMRVILFLATLGVVTASGHLAADNPAADVFRRATGPIGYTAFGVIMWSAAMSSIVGSAYTSVSFLRGLVPQADERRTRLVVAFITVSTLVFIAVGRPVKVLVAVGALNGLILPLALGTMLVAAGRPAIVGTYRHPKWMTWSAAVVAVAMAALGARALATDLPTLWR